MGKRTNREIRRALFEVLKNGKKYSYGKLESKINTNWKTIRDHIEYMELFGAVRFDDGIVITDFGLEIVKKLGAGV
jgi:predicted transcriptional regulator